MNSDDLIDLAPRASLIGAWLMLGSFYGDGVLPVALGLAGAAISGACLLVLISHSPFGRGGEP